MAAIGNESLLRTRKLALLCSRACPGSVIVHTLDLVRAIRDTPWIVVSGFQSPVEQECLDILLRGQHPVIVCPARSVEGMRLPAAWKAAIAAGRMLVTSPLCGAGILPAEETPGAGEEQAGSPHHNQQAVLDP